ncbi:hypothetical protein H263_07920, partial [Brachyspira hampsonii 30599]
IEQEKYSLDKNMKKENIDIDIISKVTGLTIEKIQKVVNSHLFNKIFYRTIFYILYLNNY